MLPAISGDYTRRDLSLTGNDSGRFEDRWVHLAVDADSPCVFTRGLERLYLPVRHGEGKIVGREPGLTRALVENHQAVLRYASPDANGPTMEYPFNPNGSALAIAGLCDATGRVFGLMPHPECFVTGPIILDGRERCYLRKGRASRYSRMLRDSCKNLSQAPIFDIVDGVCRPHGCKAIVCSW